MRTRSVPLRRRFLLALVLAVTTLAGPLAGAALAARVAANGVTWHIDHTAKLITADIRITLTPSCTTAQRIASAVAPDVFASCDISQATADAIKANIDAIWNNKDNKYYCYDFHLNIDIKIDNSFSGNDPSNRVRVQVERGTPRSFVSWSNATQGTWNSNATGDQGIAANDGSASSTWAYPPPHSYDTNLYAHEAGHILGLSDHYEDYVDPTDHETHSRPRQGAPNDIMSHQSNSNVHQDTMRRMIERAGFNKRQLKCNYKIDQPSQGGRITGLKCDNPPGGLWLANGTYSFAGASGKQSWTVTIDATRMKGTFDYADTQVMEAIAAFEVHTEGQAAGDATLQIDEELKARMHLAEKAHSYRSTIPGLPNAWGEDRNAPLTAIDLLWEPIGKCPS